MKELHCQLAIFIAKFKFSDVKYNNYPITEEGYAALFDLDEKEAVKGFLSGCADAEDGLLSDLPPEMQREAVDAAKPYLTASELAQIEEKMEAKKAFKKALGKSARLLSICTKTRNQDSRAKDFNQSRATA